MTLQQINDFLAVAQHGSLNAAARATGQAQPALSKSLRKLEDSVGATLVNRGVKGITLSTFGERFLVHARIIAAEASRGQAAIRDLQGVGVPSVRFGTSPMSSLLLSSAAIDSFRKRHPDAQLHSTSAMSHILLPLLREGQLDFAICPAPQEMPADLTSTLLVRCEVAIMGREGHPLRHATTLKQLSAATFVTGAPQGIAGAGLVRTFAQAGLPTPKVDVHTDSMVDSLALVAGSDRLALMPMPLLSTPLFRNALIRIPVQDALYEFHISLIQKRGAQLGEAARTLCDSFERESTYLMTSWAGQPAATHPTR